MFLTMQCSLEYMALKQMQRGTERRLERQEDDEQSDLYVALCLPDATKMSLWDKKDKYICTMLYVKYFFTLNVKYSTPPFQTI